MRAFEPTGGSAIARGSVTARCCTASLVPAFGVWPSAFGPGTLPSSWLTGSFHARQTSEVDKFIATHIGDELQEERQRSKMQKDILKGLNAIEDVQTEQAAMRKQLIELTEMLSQRLPPARRASATPASAMLAADLARGLEPTEA